MADTGLYGLMAEFDARRMRWSTPRASSIARATRKMDALSPMPIEGLAESMGYHDRRIQKMILAGGITGCLAGLGMQLHVNLIGWNVSVAGLYLSGYPLNVGGRPLVSLPSFIVPAFETTILFAALTAVFGMLAL